MDAGQFFNQLDALSVHIKKHLVGKYQGEQQTVYAGDGLTFKDYSPYTLGDDFRHIDWRLYVRTKELFIKRYEADRNVSMHILVDRTGSMQYHHTASKCNYALLLGAGIVYVAQKQNEHNSFVTFSKNFVVHKSATQRMSAYDLYKKCSLLQVEGHQDIYKVLHNYMQTIKSKSIVFILSDFLYDLAGLKRLMHRFPKSTFCCVQTLHKDELHLPFLGSYRFINPEQEQERIKTHISPRVQQEYKQGLDAHIKQLNTMCRQHRARHLVLNTDDMLIKNFVKMWQLL
ncbi:MAG: DUF58 domain-containing protein [Candidatus Woesearchaeota archaeon]